MPVQDREVREGRIGPFVTFVDHVRLDGVTARWGSRRHRKHRQDVPAARLDVVGTQGQGMVDRRPVRRGVAAIRPRRRPRLHQRRRGPLGRNDLLHRLAVLHRGRVSDLPRSRGCRPAGSRHPATLLRLPAPQNRLVGHRGATGGNRLLQHQHRERAAGGPRRPGRAPARVAARCGWLDLLPDREHAGLDRGLPWVGRVAPAVVVLVDHPGQPDRVRRLRRIRCRRLHRPGDGPDSQRRAVEPRHPGRCGVLLRRRPAAPARTHGGCPPPSGDARGCHPPAPPRSGFS